MRPVDAENCSNRHPLTSSSVISSQDPQATPAIRAAFDEAIAECPVEYRAVVHASAEHGYALPDRDIYDKRATNRDWELIFAVFRRQLSAQ